MTVLPWVVLAVGVGLAIVGLGTLLRPSLTQPTASRPMEDGRIVDLQTRLANVQVELQRLDILVKGLPGLWAEERDRVERAEKRIEKTLERDAKRSAGRGPTGADGLPVALRSGDGRRSEESELPAVHAAVGTDPILDLRRRVAHLEE